MSGTTKELEETLRRKEKELAKLEAQLRERADQLTAARERVDAELQELEARELVMNDAEAKHGSLLQREEDVLAKERDVLERSQMLQERFAEAARREEELEVTVKLRQREYEEKLFPLAAREQEIIRRESEVHAMELEHEAKVRAFAKKVSSEEEKERAKDKAIREQELKAKELLAAAEKRQADAEQQLATLQMRQQQLKADGVEMESRDRDLKWRDEQLRRAHQEVHDMKAKLMAWQCDLSAKEEELAALQSALGIEKGQHDLRELGLQERTTKLLQAEREVAERERALEEQVARAARMTGTAEERVAAMQERERLVASQRDELRAAEAKIEQLTREAAERDKKLAGRIAAVEQHERALKEWIVELEYREAQLVHLQQRGGGGGVNTGASSGVGDVGGGSLARGFNKGIVRMQLSEIQSRYIGATASRAAVVAARKEQLRKPIELGGGGGGGASDAYTAQLARQAAVEESGALVAALENELADFAGRFYCMPESTVERLFTPSEVSLLRAMFSGGNEEDEFLAGLLASCGGGGLADPQFGAKFTAPQWSELFQRLRGAMTERRHALLSERAARLGDALAVLRRCEAAHPDDFPRNAHIVLAGARGVSGSATISPTPTELRPIRHKNIASTQQRPLRKLPRASQLASGAPSAARDGTPSPAATALGDSAHAIDRDHSGDENPPTTNAARGGKRSPSPAGEHGGSSEREKILATLPPYLRHYYE